MLKPQSGAALLRWCCISALAVTARCILHGVAFVENNHAIEGRCLFRFR